jgi:FkbM family methyltransferase
VKASYADRDILGRVRRLEAVRLGTSVGKLLKLSPRKTLILAAKARSGTSATRPWRAETVFGCPMLLTPPDTPSMWIARYGYFEPSVMALLNCALRSGDTAVDVGAHLGFFALWVATLVGSEGSVTAVEATPRTADLLRRNVANACAPVGVIEAAAYDRTGTLAFVDLGPGAAAFNGPVDTVSEGERSGARIDTSSVLEVPCQPLDAMLANQHRVDCIKIDAEGSELAVLSGAHETLAQHRPNLVIETGDFSKPGRTRTVLDAVFALGDYRAFESDANLEVVPHVRTETYGYGNLLLSPVERLAQSTAPR